MQTSTRTTEVLSALMRAKAQFRPIAKTKHVQVTTKQGRSFSYDYAPLDSIQDATEAALTAEGLLIISGGQPGADDTVECVTRLAHAASEQWLESRLPWSAFDEVKSLGAFLSYARRFSTIALLDMTAEDDLDATLADGDHIEPRRKASTSAAAAHTHPHGDVNSNGHAPAPEPDKDLEHPTEAHLNALRTLAVTTCGEAVDAFETRLRRTAGLPAQASLAPKLLSRTLKMSTYMEVYGWYVNLNTQLAKSNKEVSDGAQPGPAQVPASPTEATPAGEEPPVDPSPASSAAGSSSAPEVSPEPEDTIEGLVAYALSLGLKEDVTRRVIHLHKDLKRCRQILTDAAARNRRQVA